MLTAADVGRLLGISARTVYAIPEVQLPRYRMGAARGAVRFDPLDVENYKASQASLPRQLTGRELRAYEAMRKAAAGLPGVPETSPLSPEQLAIAEKRVRRTRRVPWANAAAIAAIYQQAKTLSEQTGIPHHVDHIIPLIGEFVSGLHVESNLQILPATDNIRKRNRFDES